MTVPDLLRKNIFGISLLYSFQVGLLLYFNSSFLVERGFTEQQAGILFSMGYALMLVLLFFVPRVLRKTGNRSAFSGGLAVLGAALVSVSLIDDPLATALLLPLALALVTTLYTLLDLLLTNVSGDIHKVAGRRGLYTTLVHVGYILAQLVTAFLLISGQMSLLYTIAGTLFLVLAGVSYSLLSRFKDPIYEKTDWKEIARQLVSSRDLQNTFIVQFLISFFYAVMVVYTPLYLVDHMGVPVESLGLIFAVMLIPFIILEVPVGRLEDSVWNEREVLMTGFSVIALATAAIALIWTGNVVVWALALFATRVGATLIDIGVEAYFFKHVHGGDSGEVSAYRMLTPLAFILGPLLGALLISFVPFQFLFVFLSGVMLLGILPSRALNDIKK